MKKLNFIIILGVIICLLSCSNQPTDKAQSSVKKYLKEKLKNAKDYEPIYFSKLDTLSKADTSDDKKISIYEIDHIYSIVNSDKEKIKMTVSFYLDKDFKVNNSTKSINGDYGSLSGNIYWKYNDYVGNKADVGSEITIYSYDTIRKNLNYNATSDVQGNYKIEKVLPGKYFIVIRSNNTTSCPENHIKNLISNSFEINKFFDFDIFKYKKQIDSINQLDSIFTKILFDNNDSKYGGLSNKIELYSVIQKNMRDKAYKLINIFPENFKKKIKLFSGYGKSFKFSTIEIEEGKTMNIVTDFGTTCI